MSILATIKKDAEAVKSFILKVAGDAPAVFAKVVADEQAVAPVVEAFVPGSTAVLGIANTILALVEKAVIDAGAAAGSNALSVTLDAQTVSDVKAVITAASTAKK